MEGVGQVITLDLAELSVREVNQFLHQELGAERAGGEGVERIEILHPNGQHSIAAGVDACVTIDIRGHAGYYVAGMNRRASVRVHGNVGWGIAENIMSGKVIVEGNASECAAASGHGGLVVIRGDTSSRCGISLKGSDVVVGGSVGHVSGFMAQAGRMVICGDADAGLGDSLYEAVIYVRGAIHGLGADARLERMADSDYETVATLLEQAEITAQPDDFKRVASARSLYHWNSDAEQEY